MKFKVGDIINYMNRTDEIREIVSFTPTYYKHKVIRSNHGFINTVRESGIDYIDCFYRYNELYNTQLWRALNE